MEKKLVSVIIPVYNGEKTISRCLDSALRQTYSNSEVIVVDNNSADNTKKIIEGFQKKYKNLFYFYEPIKSVGRARNLGIKNSKGEILCFTDSDCVLPLNWIENLTKPIISGEEEIVAGSGKNLVENYWTKQIQKRDYLLEQRISKNDYIDNLDGKNFAADGDIIRKIMFDPYIKMMDDLDLYIRIRLKKRSKVRFLPEVKVGHYHRSSMIKFTKMIFIRGFWAFNIYKKYNEEEKKNIVMFESFSFKKNVIFPFWLAKQILTKNPADSFYITISELSWRAGIVWAILKNIKTDSPKNTNG